MCRIGVLLARRTVADPSIIQAVEAAFEVSPRATMLAQLVADAAMPYGGADERHEAAVGTCDQARDR